MDWRHLPLALTAIALAVSPARAKPNPLMPGAVYVAMGSSFAAGPGVGESADQPRNRCQRSFDNYAQQLARRLRLSLVDVSCGGATTAHILGPWNELPPQMEAVTAETRLVTITIGGNDIGYVAGLMAGSCAPGSAHPICRGLAARSAASGGGRKAVSADQPALARLRAQLTQIAREVRRRAPNAQLVFVDYVTILPRGRLCAAVPLDRTAERRARDTARRLARITRDVARREGALLVAASALSARHDACSRSPWVTGFAPPAPYHPNLAGMTAIADRLEASLSRRR